MTSTLLRTTRRSALALAAAALLPGVAAAQDAALPPAKDVIARYVQAIGGAEAVTRHASIRSTGTFEMPAAGLRGDLVLVQMPNRMSMTMTIPGLGEVVQAYDGTHAWTVNPMQGPRVLEGRELAQATEDAGYSSMLRASPSITNMETVERTELGGEACYMVKITYASGRESRECYSTETGLLVGTIAKQVSPMGEIESTTLVSEWKDFGGLKSATMMRQQLMGQEQILRVTNIEYDRADDAQAFVVPESVKALLKP